MQWQDNFALALVAPERAAPTEVQRWDGVHDQKRFNVYRNNVFVSLTESIEAGFPLTQKIVGTAFFRALARHYCADHLPKSPVMIFYGDDFPQFLSEFPPALQVPYLADMARLEFATRISTHAADDIWHAASTPRTFSPEEMLELHVSLHSSVRWLSSPYPLFDIWYYNQHDDTQPIGDAQQNLLIYRPENLPVIELLPAGGDAFLQHIKDGHTVGQAAENILHNQPDAPLAELMQLALKLATSLRIET